MFLIDLSLTLRTGVIGGGRTGDCRRSVVLDLSSFQFRRGVRFPSRTNTFVTLTTARTIIPRKQERAGSRYDLCDLRRGLKIARSYSCRLKPMWIRTIKNGELRVLWFRIVFYYNLPWSRSIAVVEHARFRRERRTHLTQTSSFRFDCRTRPSDSVRIVLT